MKYVVTYRLPSEVKVRRRVQTAMTRGIENLRIFGLFRKKNFGIFGLFEGDGLQQRVHQDDVDHRGFIDDEHSSIQWVLVIAAIASAGLYSSNRWMVLDSLPVASLMRLAARPVGAARRMRWPMDSKAAMMPRVVVLPVPGPPVNTMTFDGTAWRMAASTRIYELIDVTFNDCRKDLHTQ